MALIWLFSRQVPLAVLPFAVYSVFHVLTYTRANLLPTLFPQAQPATAQPQSPTSPTSKDPKQASGLSNSIGKFVKEYYDTSMTLVAVLEIFLWFRLVGSAVLFQKGSWVLLTFYSVFLRARYAQSSFVQGAIAHIGARIDATVAQQGTAPAARNAWETVKGLMRQLVDATDLNKYLGGPQARASPAQPKKAQ